MKKAYTKEVYRFESFDELIDAINNDEIVKVEILVDEEVLADFDVQREDESKPVSEENPLFICYNYANVPESYPIESFYMEKYL